MKSRFAFLLSVFLLIGLFAAELRATEGQSALIAGGAVQYVIVTPVRYAPIFQRLADWKTCKGVPAKVVTLEEIYRNYGSLAGNHAAQIRAFLKDAFKTWNLKWVLLGGDTKDETGELIPAKYARSGIKNTDIPSDLYYANFDGSWDGNNNGISGEFKDNCDLVPEVHVGRASVDTREEASTFINKVLEYEKNPPANWVKKALVVGVDLDDVTRGERDAEILVRDYLKGFSVKRCYDSRKTDPKQIKESMNGFSPHFVYVGAHGNDNLFAANGYFTNKDADELQNSFPFIYASISCLTNYFDKDTLSEHFMNNPHGGAVAYWACSRYGWYQPRNEGYYYSILMIKDFFNLLFNDPKNLSNHIGEVASRARTKYIPEARAEDGCFRWLVFGMNLLGDPEMPVWTDSPKKLSVQANADQKNARVLVEVTNDGKPISGALVCVRFLDEKNIGVTVTAKNAIPAELKIPAFGIGGVYNFGETDKTGRISFSTKGDKNVIRVKVEELVRLDLALKDLEDFFKKNRSNTKLYQKLTRDYQNLQNTLDRNRKEVRAFLINLAEGKKFPEIQETLGILREGLKQNPAALPQFQFALKAVTDKLRFNLAQMQQDGSGLQLKVLQEILDLQKGMTSVGSNQPAEEYGRLSVTSEPEGAQVLLDNVPHGQTPCVIDNVTFGSHVVKVQAQGLGVQSKTVQISERKTVGVSFSLASICSIRGKVTLKGNKIDKGIEIYLVKFIEEEGKSKEVVLFKTNPDAGGQYSFPNVPKEDVYLIFKKTGYNMEWKPFLFSARDQGYRRIHDLELLPLITVSGEDPSLSGAVVSLYQYSKPQYHFIDEVKPGEKGTFSFKDVQTGQFRIYAAKPGCAVGLFVFTNKEGEDIEGSLECRPVKHIRMAINTGIKEPWDKFDLTEEKDGKYRVKVSLKARKDPYCFLYFLNPGDFKNDIPYILDQKHPANRDIGFLTSVLKVEKDQDVVFEYDPRKPPVFSEKKKNADGKDVQIIGSEGIPDIR